MFDPTDYFGYHRDDRQKEAFQSNLLFPYASTANAAIKGSGKGKKFLGHDIITAVAGKYFHYIQERVGDCVAQSTAPAIVLLMCGEIFRGEAESFEGFISVEDLYGGARIQIGKGQLGYSDGCIPVHMMQYIRDYGTLLKKPYGDIDLTNYNADRSRDWGSPGRGVPKELLEIAKQHPVREFTQVKTYAECCDMLYNFYPVTIASNIAFTNKRDKDGFARVDYNNQWPHQMYCLGYDDEFKNPGVLVMNSWPTEWISGPKRHDQPEGSFWVHAEEFERTVLRANDSWAISNFSGYPQKPISPIFI